MIRMTVPCLVLIAVMLPLAQGQFPRVCITLKSLKAKECCPIPKGFKAPCGSDGNRGTCQELNIRSWTLEYSHYQPFHDTDDRRDWPYALYHKTCKCKSNFAGYDCSKCEYGYHGKNCTQKRTYKRKNFAKLSAGEKDRYMKYLNMSKYFNSDYVLTTTFYEDINRTVQAGGDPMALFYNVSNYDLFVWMHYYAARDTIHPNNITDAAIDFAHDGQGFASWHRLYMMAWEKTIRELTGDEDFALPYWDWTANPECDPKICSEELLGVTKQDDGVVKGKYFKDWYVICTSDQTNSLTKMCDPRDKKRGLERFTKKQRDEKAKNHGFTMTLPTKEEVDFALRFEKFDLPPYNKESSCNFKNILEGYASTKIGYRLPNAHTLHNQVHIAIGGTMGDVPSAANDPIFPLHHSFVDRIYEKWLRKYNKDASVLSLYDAPIGHNRDDVIVPLFPVYTHQQMFKKSFEFGYDYEDLDENGKYVIIMFTRTFIGLVRGLWCLVLYTGIL